MKISELLLEEDKSKKKPASNLPTVASIHDDPDQVDDEQDDLDQDDLEDPESEPNESFEEFKKLASDLGNNLYTLSAFDYRDGLHMRNPDPDMVKKLDELGGPFHHAAMVFKKYAGIDDGSIVQMFINGRTERVAFLIAGPGGFRFELSDNLDSDQLSQLKTKLVKAWKRYQPYIRDWNDGENDDEEEVMDYRDDVLNVLKFYKQKFPKDLLPDWQKHGYRSEEAWNSKLEWEKKSRERRKADREAGRGWWSPEAVAKQKADHEKFLRDNPAAAAHRAELERD